MKSHRMSVTGFAQYLFAAACVWALGAVTASAATTLQVGPGQTYTTIQEAVNVATAGDTIQVAAGTYPVPAKTTLNKSLTLKGAGRGTTVIEISSVWFNDPNTQQAFDITASNVLIQDLHFKVVGKGQGSILRLGGSNIEITGNKFSGEYVFGDGQVTRATEWGGTTGTGIVFQNNIVDSLRQPGYINAGSGLISSNAVNNTRGWLLANTYSGTLDFSNNTFGTNASHITILAGADLSQVSVEDNDFGGVALDWAIDNRDTETLDATLNYWGSDAGPGTTVTGSVDADPYWQDAAKTILGSDSPVQNVTKGLFYDAIQNAVNAASAGDLITVAAGTYTENVVVDKSLDIVGAGATMTIIDGGGVDSVLRVSGGIDVYAEGLTVQNGVANAGGGVYVRGAAVTLKDCVVQNNTSPIGGGLANEGTAFESVTLIGCTFAGNSSLTGSGQGGAVNLYGCELAMTNCTISGNAARQGGGLYLDSVRAGLSHLTVAFNAVSGSQATGGGMRFASMDSASTIENTLVAKNTSTGTFPNVAGTAPTGSGNLTSDSPDPLLAALADNGGPTFTHKLLPASPAINAGAASASVYDQRGVPRAQGNNPDIGAFETVRIVFVDDNWSGPENVVGHAWGQDAFSTITAAVAAVPEKGVVNVAAGTYNEALALDKPFSLVGAGDQDGGSRIETAPYAITVNSGSMSDIARLSITGFYVKSTGASAINLNNGAQYVDVDDCTLASVLKVGIRAGSAANIAHLRFTDLTFAGNLQDVYFSNETLASNSDADDILFERCAFTGSQKGIYVEKLSNALIRDCTFTGVGSDASYAWGAAIDLNLKWDDFANILIEGCSFTGCGLGSKEGMAIGVKARGTGTDSSYAGRAATLAGVTIQECTITGCERGIRIGEPGKSNTGPTGVTIINNVFDDNVHTYAGTDSSAYGDVVNAMTGQLAANGNYWGEATPNMADRVAGNVQVDTYYGAYDTGTGAFSDLNYLTVYVDDSFAAEDATRFKTLTAALAAVAPGGSIHVAAGTYAESCTLAQPVSIVGPASGDKPLIVGMLSATHTTGWATRIENINFQVNAIGVNNLKLTGVKNLTVNRCDFDGDERFMGTPGVVALQLDGACQNITVENCTFHDGYYVTIQGRAENLLVKDSTITNCKSGINIQYAYGTGLTLENTDISVKAQGAANDTYCVRFGSASGTAQNLSITGGTFTVDDNGLTPAAGTYFHAIIVREAASGTLAISGTTIHGEIANLSATPLVGVENNYYIVYVDDDYTAATSGWGQYAFATVQDAINAVEANGKVAVAAGTYTQSVTVNKPLDLVAIGAATIMGAGADAVTIATNGVNITGFTIQNPNGLHGIYALNRSQLVLADNTIENVGTAVAVPGSVPCGVMIYSTSATVTDVVITDNVIRHIESKGNKKSANGVWIGDSAGNFDISGLMVTGNTISNILASPSTYEAGGRGAYGIIINHSISGSGLTVAPVIKNNIITDLEGVWAHAIGLEGNTPNAVVQGNSIARIIDHKSPADPDAVGIMVEANLAAASVLIESNRFSEVLSGVRNDTEIPVTANGNYWGSATPDIDTLIIGDVVADSFYADSGLTELLLYTVYVDAALAAESGNQFKTIQGGVNGVSLYGTVHVAAGSYNEQVAIGKTLNLLGADDTTTTINGGGSNIVVMITANGVEISGFTVTGSGTSGAAGGIALLNVTGCSVTDNTLVANLAGIAAAGGGNHVISGNTLTGNGNGIALVNMGDVGGSVAVGSTNNSVSGNTVAGSLQHGIWVAQNCNDNVVEGNTVTGTAGSGIYVWKTLNNTVRNNTVSANAVGINNFSSANTIVTNNTVTANAEGVLIRTGVYGALEPSSTNVVLARNTIANNTVCGVNATNNQEHVVSVSENYWGTAYGPSGDGYFGTGDTLAGPVDIASYYIDAPLTALHYYDLYVDDGFTPEQLDVNHFQTIPDAYAASNPGDTIHVADGTYTLGSTFTVAKQGLAIIGTGSAKVSIDATDRVSTAYGIHVAASDVTLQGFTLLPDDDLPPAGQEAKYGAGFPIHVSGTPAILSNITLRDIVIADSYRTPFDFNGVNNLTLDGLVANRAIWGSGIGLSGCVGVTITGCQTAGNAWGGVRVSGSTDVDPDRASSAVNVNFTSNTFAEVNALYIDVDGAGSTVNATGYSYRLVTSAGTATYLEQGYTEAQAIAIALQAEAAFPGLTVTGLYEAAGNQVLFDGDMSTAVVYVDDDWTNKVAGAGVQKPGAPASTYLQFGRNAFATVPAGVTGVDAGGTVHVLAGTYTDALLVGKAVTLLGPNAGVNPNAEVAREPEAVLRGTTPSGLSARVELDSTNVVINGFTFDNLRIDNYNSQQGTNSKLISGVAVANNVFTNVTGTAIYLRDGRNSFEYSVGIAILNNKILPLASAGVGDFEAGSGMIIYGAEASTISGNVIVSASYNGIQLARCKDTSITGNTATGAAQPAFQIAQWNDGAVITVSNNTFSTLSTTKAAVRLYGFTGSFYPLFSMTGNTIKDSKYGIQIGHESATKGYNDIRDADYSFSGNTFSNIVTYRLVVYLSTAASAAELTEMDGLFAQTYAAGSTAKALTAADPFTYIAVPSPVWVDDGYTAEACDGHIWGYDAFTNIQVGVNAVVTAGTVHVAAGTYAEAVAVSKSVDLRGPNYGISPNGGTRVAEAIVVPTTTNNTESIFAITASNVSIDGFTVDGDNPTLPDSGVGFGGLSGTSIDAMNGVYANANSLTNVTVRNNVVENYSGSGIRLQQVTESATLSFNNVLADNRVANAMVAGIYVKFGMYAAMTDNVISNASYGIYVKQMRTENKGGAASRVISGNRIEARNMGLWFNLYSATPYTVSDNTVTPFADSSVAKWYGIMMSTVSGAQNFMSQSNLPQVATPESFSFVNNTIDGAAMDPATMGHGYWFWSLDNFRDDLGIDHYTTINGGAVSGVDIGVFLLNVDNDKDNTGFLIARTGAHAAILGTSISVKSGGKGIYLKDDPSWTTANITPLTAKRDVILSIGAGVSVTGGAQGIFVEQSFASVQGSVSDLAFTGQTGDYIQLVANTNNINATAATFDGLTGTSANTAQNFAIENKITHKVDDGALGFVRAATAAIYVPVNSGTIDNAIAAASDGDVIYVENGVPLVLTAAITKSITFSGTFAITAANIPNDARATTVLTSFISRCGTSTVSVNVGGMNDAQIAAVNANLTGFASVTGNPVTIVRSGTTVGYAPTIQSGVNFASAGDVVNVAAGTYNERVVVNKANLTVQGAGADSIVTGTTAVHGSGVMPSVFKVTANGVTVKGFKILVDFAFNHSAVHTSETCSGLTVSDNTVIASVTGTAAFGYGLRNAIAVNADLTVTGYIKNSVGYAGVSVSGNTIEGTGTAFFRSGIQMDLCAGTISGNTITSINHDFLSRFANQGDITVSDNQFLGGGAQVGSFNPGAGTVTITNNVFDSAIMQPETGALGTGAALRLVYFAEVASVDNAVVVSCNTFKNHRWGVSVENFKNVTFDGNTFTPRANATDFVHMSFNTKIIASTVPATLNRFALGGTLLNNVFNGSGTAGGTALAFYNHHSEGALFGAVTLGSAGAENTFQSGIARFAALDNSAGASSGWTLFGGYGTSTPVTTMAPWAGNLDAQNNLFAVEGGLKLPVAMSSAELFAVEDKITHKLDTAALGLVRVKASNVYVTLTSGTIQRGIDAATVGDTVNVGAGTFNENIALNKRVVLDGQGDGSNPVVDTVVTSALANTPVIRVTASGSSGTDRLVVRDLRVTGATPSGNNGSGILMAATGAYYTFDNVASVGNGGNGFAINLGTGTITDLALINCNFSDNTGIGFRLASNDSIDGMTVSGSHFDRNNFGFYNERGVTASFMRGLRVTDSTFEGNVNTGSNSGRGFQVEKLTDAIFTRVSFSGNQNHGALFNLKNGNYADIAFTDCVFNGNTGAGTAGLSMMARNDGSNATNPAFLTNVDITGCVATGNSTGISLGNNITDMTVAETFLAGNASAGLVNWTDSGTVLAENNWWGDATGPANASNPGGIGAVVFGNTDFSPWLAVGTENSVTGAAIGFQPVLTPVYYKPATLVFTPQPGGAALGAALNPLPSVTVLDEIGQVATQFVGNVSLSISFNPGFGLLAGTTNMTATAGVASFSNVAVANDGGAGFKLTATVGALTVESGAFTITSPNPALSSIDPIFIVKGSEAFTLTVSGSAFVPSSTVLWNGTPRVTTYVSANQLTAAIPATDRAAAGTAQISVASPAATASGTLTFTITETALAPVVYVDGIWTGPANCGIGHVWGYDAFATIGTALTGVAQDGIVNVMGGAYAENASTTKRVKVIGALGAGGERLATLTGSLFIDNNGAASNDGLEIKNLVFALATADTLKLYGVNGGLVENCAFVGNTTGWSSRKAILLDRGASNGNSDVLIKGCVFSGGFFNAIQGYCLRLTVQGCMIADVYEGGINLQGGGGSLVVQNSDITVIPQIATQGYCVRFPSSEAANMTLTGCNLSLTPNNPAEGSYHAAVIIRAGASGDLVVSNCAIQGGIVNLDDTMVNASGNWWGSIDTAVVKTAANGGTLVDYSPWLAVGADTDNNAVGFKGNFATLNVDAASPKAGTVGYIQEGVNLADTNGTVNVLSGTYAEHVAIVKAVSVLGADKATTFIDGGGSGIVLSVTANNTAVRGFTVRNSGATATDCGIALIGVSGCSVSDNAVTLNGVGIGLLSASGNTVASNEVTGNGYGIGLDKYLENPGATNNLVLGNTVSQNQAVGIYAGESSDNTLGGNTVTGNGDNGIYLWKSGGYTVTNNVVADNTKNGIELMGSRDNRLEYNFVTNNAADGLCLRNGAYNVSTNNEVHLNDLSGNTGYGLNAEQYCAVRAENNWWGSVKGPAHVSNPGGDGAAVTDDADFSPWLGDGEDTDVAAIGFQPNATPVYYLPVGLTFSTQPANAALGATMATVTVQVTNEIGQIATQFTNAVTLAVGWQPGSGVLTGTLTKDCVAGEVSFADLAVTIDGGVGFRLAATALTLSKTSESFDIANPQPALTSMSPIFIAAGSDPFTLTLTGSGFVGSSKVMWGSTELTPSSVAAGQLVVTVSKALVASAGTVSVTVANPAPVAGTSAAQTFTITPAAQAPVVYVDGTWTGPANCGVGHVWGYDAFATIQSAINGVAANGVIHVNAGTYTEQASAINKEIDIIGETAPDGSPLPLIVGQVLINHTGSDIGWRIENLRFRAGGAGSLLSLANVNRAAVANCVFDGAGRFADDPAVNGLAFESATNGNTFPTVTDCVFSNGLYSAITGIASDLTVSNCVIDNVKSGMNMRGSRMSVLDSEIAVKAVTTTDTYGIRYGTAAASTADGLNVQGCVISVNQNGFEPQPGDYHCAIYVRAGASGVQKVSNCTLAGDIVNLSTSITLDMSGNWWGSADAAAVQTAANGGTRVDYSPWLTSGTDTAGDARGFKGNFATLKVDAASPKAGTVGYIQEGVNLIDTNGTVNVLSGTYAEHVAIAKAVSVLGADKATTFIDGSADGVVVQITASQVALKGFTVRNSGADLNQHAGIAAVGTTAALTGLVIEDNIVTNNATGVALLGASAVVQNNAIVDNARYGIVMSSSPYNAALLSTGNTVSGNTLRGNARDGIYCDAACGGNQIVGNWIGGATGTIEGGEAEPEGNGVYLWFSSDNVVRFNEIVGNAVYGLELMMSDGNTITNNVVTNNSAGICVRYGNSEQPFASNAVHFNDVSGNTAFGIALNFTADFQKNKADYALNAENNWFGHLTGPAHSSNPGGTGKAVADYVDFSPWLGDGTEDPVTGAAIGFQPVLTPVYYLPAGIKFSTEPTGALLGAAFGTQPAVTVTNEIGGIATQFNGSIALAIGNDTNPGAPVAGELTGTATLPVVDGVASFSGLSIVKGTGNGYTLVASTLGLPAVTSQPFNILNSTPVLTAVADWSTGEQSAPSTFTAQATDTAADLVEQTLTFSLACTNEASMPEGISFNEATGAFSWQTVESQGGKAYTFLLTVTDDGTGAKSASDTFTVTVNEVNVAPTISIADTTLEVNEQPTQALTFTATATDQDRVPTQALTFSLVAVDGQTYPTGAQIVTADAGDGTASGAFSWSPTESQGGMSYAVDVVVTDNGTPANLTATQRVTIAVAEINVAPVLATIPPQSVNFGQTLTFTASATDDDLEPLQTLTYSMTGAPAGAELGESSGVFTWTPTAAQAQENYTFTVKVTDNGSPARSDEQDVTIGAISAAHSCPGYWSPSTNTVVSNTFAFAGTPTGLTWTPVLPNANWIITAVNAGDNGVAVVSNGSAVVFTTLPATSPVVFTYTVSVPGDQVVSNSLGAVVSFSGLTAQVAPLPIFRYHSADYRGDVSGAYAGQFRKIDSTEINRVLAYWRNGGYSPNAQGFDGYAAISNTVLAAGFHSSDINRDWQIDDDEILLPIGYWSAGGYHVNPNGADGYAAGNRTGVGPRMLAGLTLPTVTQTGPSTYNPGGTVAITCTLSSSAKVLALSWTPALPAGWVIESVSGDGSPEQGRVSIVCTDTLPGAPIRLVYTVRVPLTEYRTISLGGVFRMLAADEVAAQTYAMDTLALVPADSDNNGMADAWEKAYAGAAGTLEPGADLDGDLRSNIEEFLCGTVPTNADSVLKMVALVALPDGKTQISWASVAGRAYTLQRADGSPAEANFTTIMTGITADPSGRNVYVDDVDRSQARFYRVLLQD